MDTDRRAVLRLCRRLNYNRIYKYKMSRKNMDKRGGIDRFGQVTVFIIVAILIVVGILVYFLWVQPTYVAQKVERLKGFDGCVQDAIEGEMDNLGKHGGYINPEFSYMYSGDDVGYLCYTNLYYKPCIMQQPFLKQHFESQLKMAISEKVNDCYSSSISELKNRGFDVVRGNMAFDIALEPGQAVVKIKAPTSVSSGETAQRFDTFDAKIPNPIYDMLMISTSILQYETKFGDSDVTTLMIFYPQFIIDKIKRSDGTTVYILIDKETQTKFQFASRSFAWPPGYGFGTGLVGDQ